MGYFQIELTEESQALTVFNTPFGRYKYRRLPMGISVAPEIYQRAMSELLAGLAGVEVIMDDILIHAPTTEMHNTRLQQVLQRCRDRNLKLNPRKTKLCTNEVEYIGHKLTDNGVKIGEDKVRAVLEMPEPSSIAHVQTLLGMVTYTCKFLPNLSIVTEPLRCLIKESHEHGFRFHFDEVHRDAVTELKKLMTEAPVLRYYSDDEHITISCDASQAGIGAVLMQNGRPIAYASKSLTSAEYAYAQVEKELLAIMFSFKKFHSYVYGRSDITVETDHLPLVRILEKPLHLVPLRLQKMKMTLQHYSFTVVGKSGKDIPVADALSRAYLQDTYEDLLTDENNFNVYAAEVRGSTAFSDTRMTELNRESRLDTELQRLKDVIHTGWPRHKHELHPDVRPFYDSREELSVLDEIEFKGDRVVVPTAMWKVVLKNIHESHLGIVRCKQLARDVVYWPGMNSQIEDMISNCSTCQEKRRCQQKEPLMPSEVPTGPWKILATDLLYCNGTTYLVTIDYYSEYIDVEELKDDSYSSTVVERLAKLFSMHGIPEKLLSDNGPQFSSHHFAQFATEWNFKHITTSPTMHQANGMVERANQTVRRMIEKMRGDKVQMYAGLLNLRNTSRTAEAGSPAQRLMGRRTATKLPTSDQLLQPKTIETERIRETLQTNRDRAKLYYDRNAKPLQDLRAGNNIRVRDGKMWKPALMLPQEQQPPHPRSYNLQAESGNVWRRNRKDILKTKEREMSYRRDPVQYEDPETQIPNPIPPALQTNPPSPERKSHPIPELPNCPTPEIVPQTNVAGSRTRSGRETVRPAKFRDL